MDNESGEFTEGDEEPGKGRSERMKIATRLLHVGMMGEAYDDGGGAISIVPWVETIRIPRAAAVRLLQ